MTLNVCNSIDCGRKPVENKPPRPLPAIDLLAKDYDSLLRAMLDLLPSRAPGWSERTEADLGMALLELFAYSGDQLSYQQDRVALEGFLRTATQYESVRKLLRLIDYAPDHGHAARVELVIEAAGNAPLYLPADFQVRTRETPNATAVMFELGAGVVVDPALSRMALSVDAPDNAAGDQAVLASIDTTALAPGMRVLLQSPSQREYATVAARSIGGATTTVTFTAPLANRYPATGAGAGMMFGNVAPATHGATERLRATGTGRPAQFVALEQAPLTYVLDARNRPQSTLTVSVDGEAQDEVEDFVSSDASDAHYRLTRDNLGFVTVRFGDGSRGRVPPAGALIDVAYRHGTGESGHVARDTLTEFTAPAFPHVSQRLLAIRNAFAARGASEPQALASAKLLGPRQLARQRRAVTEADCESIVMQGVELDGRRVQPAQAKARFQFTGSWMTAVVSIDLPDRAPLRAAPALRSAFESLLDEYKLMGSDVRVEDARYAPVSIALVVEVQPEHFARDVRREVDRVLVGVDPASRSAAFFSPGRFRFGQKLHLSDLYAAVTSVQGVKSVAVTRFKRLGDRYPDRELLGFVDVGALEVIRCDSDAGHTENGVLFVRTRGGKDG